MNVDRQFIHKLRTTLGNTWQPIDCEHHFILSEFTYKRKYWNDVRHVFFRLFLSKFWQLFPLYQCWFSSECCFCYDNISHLNLPYIQNFIKKCTHSRTKWKLNWIYNSSSTSKQLHNYRKWAQVVRAIPFFWFGKIEKRIFVQKC